MKIHPALRTSDGELLPWAMRNTSARIREGLVSFPGQPARLGGGSALSRRKWVHLNAAATLIDDEHAFEEWFACLSHVDTFEALASKLVKASMPKAPPQRLTLAMHKPGQWLS